MIAVTRLDGTPMIVNSDQITWIEYNPDTVVALSNGEKLIVRESAETLVERVKEFKRAISSAPRRIERPIVTESGATGTDPW